MDIPQKISLVPAVGKWHLGAHIPECFPKYSLNFVDGIGQIDGEISGGQLTRLQGLHEQ